MTDDDTNIAGLHEIAAEYDEDAPVSDGFLDTEPRDDDGEQFGYDG